jgi:hypothetical protein
VAYTFRPLLPCLAALLWFTLLCQAKLQTLHVTLPLAYIHAGNRTVYLPKGADWVHYFTNKSYTGGQNVTVDAPLDEFPLFTMTAAAVTAATATLAN